MSNWVRVVIVGPDGQVASSRDVEDSWYAAGGYQHPDHWQQAREELAASELGDWLVRCTPPPGPYTVRVAELDRRTNRVGQTWAQRRLNYPGGSPIWCPRRRPTPAWGSVA